jgi:hypothetical protein
MAERATDVEPIDYSIGSMDISEHKATFNIFIGLVKWSSVGIAALLLLLTLWFGTDLGFFPALIVAVVVLFAGVFLLKAKNESDRPH